MKRILLTVLLSCSACSIVNPDYIAAEGHALSTAAPGTGYIRSIAVVPNARAGESASRGASANPHAYRLFVEMDNGRTQTVDIDSDRFMEGQRVEIAGDGRVVAF